MWVSGELWILYSTLRNRSIFFSWKRKAYNQINKYTTYKLSHYIRQWLKKRGELILSIVLPHSSRRVFIHSFIHSDAFLLCILPATITAHPAPHYLMSPSNWSSVLGFADFSLTHECSPKKGKPWKCLQICDELGRIAEASAALPKLMFTQEPLSGILFFA